MATYALRRFTQPEAILSIDPGSLIDLLDSARDYFAGRGLTLPAPGGADRRIDYGKLIEVLADPGRDTPKELAHALYFCNELATRDGMDALLEAVPAAAPPGGFGTPVTPIDVAVRAWLEDHEAVERVHAELAATHPRRFEYFQTLADPVPPFDPPGARTLAELEAALNAVFARKHRGEDGCRVFVNRRTDGDCLFMIRHGEPFRREGVLDGKETSCVLYRPLRFDVAVYDPDVGTLGVNAKAKWETSLYRQELGRHLFGAIDFFSHETRYTLEPLRTDGRRALVCSDVAGLRDVTLTEVEWRVGGVQEERRSIRAHDVFAVLAKEPLPARPVITYASFTVRMDGGAVRTVTVEPPNVAGYCRDGDGVLIDRFLRARGFVRDQRARTADEQGDLLFLAGA